MKTQSALMTIALVAVIACGAIYVGTSTGALSFSVAGTTPVTTPSSTGTCPTGYTYNANTQTCDQSVVSCSYQPTAAYSAKDIWANTIVPTTSGTSYYRVNGDPATTTAATNVNPGTQYSYWLLNNTGAISYYVEPKTMTAGCGVNEVQAKAYRNGTATVTAYDTTNHATIANATHNLTLGAGASANMDITYVGTSRQPMMPFGGLMVVEYNSTITDVTCSGNDVQTGTGNFHITYTPASTAHTYKVYTVLPTLDDGSPASSAGKTVHCQFSNQGVAVGQGARYNIGFYAANYYLTNDGTFALDVENFLNQGTTRQGLGSNVTFNGFWNV